MACHEYHRHAIVKNIRMLFIKWRSVRYEKKGWEALPSHLLIIFYAMLHRRLAQLPEGRGLDGRVYCSPFPNFQLQRGRPRHFRNQPLPPALKLDPGPVACLK